MQSNRNEPQEDVEDAYSALNNMYSYFSVFTDQCAKAIHKNNEHHAVEAFLRSC
jgi:hypothetical protein